MLLGVGGKMGPTLARMARRAAPEQADPRRRPLQQPGGRGGARGARSRDDPRRPARPRGDRAPAARPERDPDGRPQVRHERRAVAHVGDEHHPADVRRRGDGARAGSWRSRPATSTRSSRSPRGGATEDEPLLPAPGDYAASCLGRERVLRWYSETRGTPGLIFRLNYAIDLRYGVLHDVGAQGARRRARRRDHGPRQRDLAGRRERDGAALPAALHDADGAAQRDRARDGLDPRARPRVRASASASRRRSSARRRRPRC